MTESGKNDPASQLFSQADLQQIALLESVRDDGGLPDFLPANDVDSIEEALEIVEASESLDHHFDCWDRYLKRHLTPTHWRGKRDELHYERIIAELIDFQRIIRDGRTQIRVQLSEWLRDRLRAALKSKARAAAVRRCRIELREINTWFKSLAPESRAQLCDSYRLEAREREREKRMVAKFNEILQRDGKSPMSK